MRVLPVAKRKSRRAPRPRHFLNFFCKKAKETRGTALSASSGTLQCWQCAYSYLAYLKKNVFFSNKHAFFKKHGPSVPRGRRPLRVALLLPLCMRRVPRFFYFCNTHTFSFLGPVPGFFAQEGPPDEFFCSFFGRFLGRICYRRRFVKSLRRGFFCDVEKVRAKAPKVYVGWGLLKDPLLHALFPY